MTSADGALFDLEPTPKPKPKAADPAYLPSLADAQRTRDETATRFWAHRRNCPQCSRQPSDIPVGYWQNLEYATGLCADGTVLAYQAARLERGIRHGLYPSRDVKQGHDRRPVDVQATLFGEPGGHDG